MEVKEFKLNEELLLKQKVTEDQFNNLQRLYNELANVFESAYEETDMSRMPIYAMQVEGIEYELQANWNFVQSANYHSYWYKLPNCTCPVYDNQERMGTEIRITNMSCPAHAVSIMAHPKGIH